MEFTPLAFMELFVVLAFAISWFVVERVARRLDRKRPEKSDKDDPKSLT
jgi:hypothetical protein